MRSNSNSATLWFMDAKLAYRHRLITEADVVFIQQLIAANPTASRRQLSKLLCQAWNWIQPNGALRDMVCRGLMLKLHREGLIQLPAIKKKPRNPLVERNRPTFVAVDAHPLTARLSEIQPLEFRQVRRTPEEPLFNSLMEQHHYLRYQQSVGENIKYLVYAGTRPIACVAWSSAPRHLGSRDRFIGWSAAARRQNIRFLAYNTRFLILPWISVKHLASHILGRMAKLVPADWTALYGHPVYFLETFVDPQRFRGTCYRAANWVLLGRTTGRGNNAPTKKATLPIKEVLGYPLCRDFRQRLAKIGD
ncbi:MAG: DUF4338 domain-containing protein [Acidobacteriaceae bacterium]